MTDRHLELSGKFIEMGQALVAEGRNDKDYVITSAGTFFTLIGGLMYDEKDVSLFAEICSMFSAKKVLENMENDMDFVKGIENQTNHNYDDIIKRINKLRDESEDDISDEEKDEEDED
jgi:hypothetical protein